MLRNMASAEAPDQPEEKIIEGKNDCIVNEDADSILYDDLNGGRKGC